MIQAVCCPFLSPFAKTCVLDFPVYDTKRRKADLAKDNSNSDAQILHIFYEPRPSYASALVCWLENTKRFGKKSWLLKGLQVGASKLIFIALSWGCHAGDLRQYHAILFKMRR
jgi:hypothetical protein